jgi:hypothetical protein
MVPNYPINGLSADTGVNMGRFARLAHATHHLAQVVRHISDKFPNHTIQEEEITQLDRTIASFIVLCKLESRRTNLRYCNPISICASALLMLHGHYLAPVDPAPSAKGGFHRELSWLAIQALCQDIVDESQGIIDAFKNSIPEVSPMVLHSTYKAAVCVIRMSRENTLHETEEWLQAFREVLVTKNKRWKAAGKYYAQLLKQDVTILIG